jgi:hypothetical protein
MKTYIVEYSATYNVYAETEEEALAIGQSVLEENPEDGKWEVMIDHYDSNNYTTLGEED